MPPLPPPNGYINFHSSESSITFVCQNSTPTEAVQIVSHCDLNGKWIPNPTEFCSGNYYLFHVDFGVNYKICRFDELVGNFLYSCKHVHLPGASL